MTNENAMIQLIEWKGTGYLATEIPNSKVFEMAMDALEKRLRKPVLLNDCDCGTTVSVDMKYCPNCGQGLGIRYEMED